MACSVIYAKHGSEGEIGLLPCNSHSKMAKRHLSLLLKVRWPHVILSLKSPFSGKGEKVKSKTCPQAQ